jgi:6-phosphofructokinase 2
VVDTSGEPLKQAVEEGIFLCKPNLGELSNLLGKERLKPEEVVAAARAIIEKGGCEMMAVLDGCRWGNVDFGNRAFCCKSS